MVSPIPEAAPATGLPPPVTATPESTITKTDAAKPAEKKEERPAFVKGELSRAIGSSKLVTKNNRIGIGLGYELLENIHYLTVSPETDIRMGELAFGIGVKLPFELFNANLSEATSASDAKEIAFGNLGRFKKDDYQAARDFVRILRYLTYGSKEDHFFFNLNQYGSNTLGHGALMRRYTTNLDPMYQSSVRVSAELDAYNDYGGFEWMTNSITDADVFGGIAFIKPLSFFLDDAMSKSLSIGFTYVADRHAPVDLELESGFPYRVNQDVGRPKVKTSSYLQGMGLDVEIKLLKTDTIDIKPYLDYSWLMPSDPTGIQTEGGGGVSAGVLGRFSFGEKREHAVRAVAELRSFSATYVPGYFDIFYEFQKYFARQDYVGYADSHAGALAPTKFRDIFVDSQSDDRHLGFYLEAAYALVGDASVTLALEGSNAERANHFMAHLEVPALDFLQFFATFHQRGMTSLADLFSNSGADKFLFTAARLRLLPFMFINAQYNRTFRLVESNATFSPGNFSTRFYQPVNEFRTDVELGWEF